VFAESQVNSRLRVPDRACGDAWNRSDESGYVTRRPLMNSAI